MGMDERFTTIGEARVVRPVVIEKVTDDAWAPGYWAASLERSDEGFIGKTPREAAEHLRRYIPEAEIDWAAVDALASDQKQPESEAP